MKDVLIDVYKAKDIFTGLGQFTLNYIDALRSVELPDINFTLLTPWQLETDKKGGFNSIEANFRQRYIPNLNRNFDLWHSLQQLPSHYPI
jgi:hypothetical protein